MRHLCRRISGRRQGLDAVYRKSYPVTGNHYRQEVA